jgi:hypothetical protein
MQATTQSQVQTTEPLARKPHSLVASDRVEGTVVRRTDGQRIGTIHRLMIDKLSGNVAYAVLSFGGIFGMGQKHLPIPWSRLHFNPDLDAYQLDISDEELDRAPAYAADKDFDWGDRSGEIVLHRYYGAAPYWGAL